MGLIIIGQKSDRTTLEKSLQHSFFFAFFRSFTYFQKKSFLLVFPAFSFFAKEIRSETKT